MTGASGLNVRDAFEESYAAMEAFVNFAQNIQASFENQCKKSSRRKKEVESALLFPTSSAIDKSSGAQSSNDQTLQGSKLDGRPARGAALRARQGLAVSYKLMSNTKLRRPTHYDPNKASMMLPTILASPLCGGRVLSSSEEDIFRKPAIPPIGSEDAKGIRRSKRVRASKNTRKNTNQEIEETDSTSSALGPEALPVESMEVNSTKSLRKTKTLRKNTELPSTSTVLIGVDTEAAAALEQTETDVPRTRTKTIDKDKQETASTSPDVNNTVTVAVELMETDVPRTRTKTIRKIKQETASTSPDVNNTVTLAVELMETDVPRTRTKTIRKIKQETASTSPVLNNTVTVAVEPMETDVPRTRTKTIRKNKQDTALPLLDVTNTTALGVELMDADSARTGPIADDEPEKTSTRPDIDVIAALPLEPIDSETARTRTKTIRKDKPGSFTVDPVDEDAKRSHTTTGDNQPESTSVSTAPFKAKRKPPKSRDGLVLENTVSCKVVSESQEVPAEVSRRSKRSFNNPINATYEIRPDPMDTLDLPEGMLNFTEQGSNKRFNDPSHACDVPGVKRRKSSDNTVEDLLVVHQNVPRTRSKMKAIVESRSRSVETIRSGLPGPVKENSHDLPLNFILGTYVSEAKCGTPVGMRSNMLMSPRAKTTGSGARNKPGRFVKEPAKENEKAKMAEARRKEEEALKKKQELMLLKKKEIRNQREMKMKKVTESRAAVEKEKLLQLEKEKKEREEKEKQAKAELLRQKEEALLKKKLLNQQKAQEAEERRQKEEQIRLARLREQEEEQRKAAEARQRQVEEAERLAALRKQQQKEEERARQLEKAKEKAKQAEVAKNDTVDPDDYGINDGDSDEQGTSTARPVPKWAHSEVRNVQLSYQAKVSPAIIRTFFNVEPRSPNLREIFGREALIRPRTSSAVWGTPPPPPSSST